MVENQTQTEVDLPYMNDLLKKLEEKQIIENKLAISNKKLESYISISNKKEENKEENTQTDVSVPLAIDHE